MDVFLLSPLAIWRTTYHNIWIEVLQELGRVVAPVLVGRMQVQVICRNLFFIAALGFVILCFLGFIDIKSYFFIHQGRELSEQCETTVLDGEEENENNHKFMKNFISPQFPSHMLDGWTTMNRLPLTWQSIIIHKNNSR